MDNQQQKILNKIKRDFFQACEDNLKLEKQLFLAEERLVKAINDNNNLFIEVYQIELQNLSKIYMENAIKVAHGIVGLGLHNQQFQHN
jgi:hypothetical protein